MKVQELNLTHLGRIITVVVGEGDTVRGLLTEVTHSADVEDISRLGYASPIDTRITGISTTVTLHNWGTREFRAQVECEVDS